MGDLSALGAESGEKWSGEEHAKQAAGLGASGAAQGRSGGLRGSVPLRIQWWAWALKHRAGATGEAESANGYE